MAFSPILLIAMLLGQQEGPPKDPAQSSRVSVEARPSNALVDGTPIKLKLLNPLNSKTARNEDQIAFGIVNDVVVGGVTVLQRGAKATGSVTQAAASKTMGRAGRLTFVINDIKLGNGVKVPVRAFSRTSGENRTGEMVTLMLSAPIAAAPFFLLIHGTNTTFPKGTEITAYVNGDLQLDLKAFVDAAHEF